MKKLLAALFIFLLLAAPAYAQAPTEDQTFENDPFDFEVRDYDTGEENAVTTGLLDLLTSADFINEVGSIAVSIWAMLDNFAGGGVFGYYAVIVAGVLVIGWLAAFVMKQRKAARSTETRAESAEEMSDKELGSVWSTVGKELNRRKHF